MTPRPTSRCPPSLRASVFWRTRFFFAIAVTLASPLAHAQTLSKGQAPAEPVSITVHARTIETFDLRTRETRRFGQLDYRSGLVLTSSFRNFGGLSAFRLDTTGERFVAVSDRGDWFTGRLVYSGKAVSGVADVISAPLLAENGRPIRSRKLYDSESLAFDGVTAYVGIERANRILRYDFAKNGVRARGREMAVPPAFRKLPYNKGPEGMVIMPKGHALEGALLVASERALDAEGNLTGFLIGGPRPGQFGIRRSANYDVSDVALLPDGDLLLLERKFSLLGGLGIRIRRIAGRSIAPNAVVDGAVIFEADLGQEVDNMEALDVHRNAEGETILTLVSDDNFSFLQRTLLLQFALIEE